MLGAEAPVVAALFAALAGFARASRFDIAGTGSCAAVVQGAGGWVAAWDCVTNACAYSDLKRASANYGL